MKIVAYWDLELKSDLLPLMEQAFGWTFNEREFSRFIKIDPRLRNGSIGFCALEDEKVVSYVGVMDLATRILDGTLEYVGGVYGVATLPGYTRQGFSTALFNTAHEYFKEKGYRFSFLNTSPNLVAYSLYKKLDYSDVVYYPTAYKVMKGKRTTVSKEKGAAKPDLDRILPLYNAYVKGRTGFVVRDRSYLEMLMRDKKLTSKGATFSEKGYAIFKKETNSTRIQELVALNKEEMDRLISSIEQNVREVIFARAVLDEKLLQIYQSRGYTVLRIGHGVFMVKPLKTEASFAQVYGEDFFQTDLDHF